MNNRGGYSNMVVFLASDAFPQLPPDISQVEPANGAAAFRAPLRETRAIAAELGTRLALHEAR